MSIILADPRRHDRTAYWGLLRCRNDAESFKRHLEFVMELLGSRGYSRLFGPTGLSPHLEAGLLQDSWDVIPPLHTPYAPPYLPEIVERWLRPLARSQLYHLDIPPELPSDPPVRAKLIPLDPQRLATDLLPLLAAAIPTRPDFPPPDTDEATFLLRRLGQWPLIGWLAEVDGQPVGFTLLQPDLAPRLRLAKGGRNLLWRIWLNWVKHRSVQQGRVPFGTVLPGWQGQGVGSQLLHQAQQTARQQGWRRLIFGPLPMTATTVKFIKKHGAIARQTYLLYQKEL
jgi:GNAT superfamily N-acetyltransferase